MQDEVFECQMCGHCCEGKGGIVLSEKDLRRLADWLEMAEDDFIGQYAENTAGKLKIRCGSDGFCVLFKSGCSVHPAKPDVCRAWPFFRGNLVDSYSLEMAKSFCPGINKNISFADFSAYGLDQMRKNGLISDSSPANALHSPGADK